MDPMENRSANRNHMDLDGGCPEEDVWWDEADEQAYDERRAEVEAYMIAAELEYGDGNTELPYRLLYRKCGEMLIDQYS